MNEIVNLLKETIRETLEISIVIFVLMIVIELLVLRFKDTMIELSGRKKFWAYIMAMIGGAVPGCMGLFAMDSLYMAGYLSIGALVSSMLTTMGDEGFVIMSMAIEGSFSIHWLLILFSSLVVIGVLGGVFADVLARKFNIVFKEKCDIIKHEHDKKFSMNHFFTHHIFHHIFKKHVSKIAIWVFLTVFILGYIKLEVGDISHLFSNGFIGLIMVAGLGLLPVSGPHIIIIMLFAQGAIPFSFLLTNSIVQDGHGMLPILGFSLKDAVRVKLYKLALALIIGGSLFMLGY